MFAPTASPYAGFEGVEGFGMVSPMEAFDLQKALRASSAQAIPSSFAPGDAFALQPESLEQTLYNQSFDMSEIAFWKALDKVPAFELAEQYTRLESYGQGIGAFITQGELPPGDDSVYSRQMDIVKFMGTTRAVTHVMQNVRTHIGNAIAQETINGTMWLLERVERALFYGDSDLVPEEFDGIFKLLAASLPTTSIIDLRGKPMSQQKVEEGTHIARAYPNHGKPDTMWMSDGSLSDLAVSFYATQRSQLPASADGTIGFVVDRMRTNNGLVKFQSDIFIQPGREPIDAGVGEVGKRPGAFTIGTGAASSSSASKFISTDAGDYRYKVVARNRHGLSAPVSVNSGSAITVSAGDKVVFAINNNASPAATAYVIYRSDKNGAASTCKEMVQIAKTAGATTTFTDNNDDIPGTTKACLLEMTKRNISIKQLAPFTRVPLATIDLQTRWAQVLYLVLSLRTPRHNILYKNVGRIDGVLSPSI